MDEPTSALDPKSTEAIEELIIQLKRKRAIVLATHNFGQAQRVADRVACIAVREGAGELIKCGLCGDVLGAGGSEDLFIHSESWNQSKAKP